MIEADLEDELLDRFERALDASDGFCLLMMWEEAWKELDDVPANFAEHTEVLTRRLRIYAGLKLWVSAAIIAESLVSRGIRSVPVFVDGATAIRHSQSLRKARSFLLSGTDVANRSPLFHYNLACFEAQLGSYDAARRSLQNALTLDEQLADPAAEDRDLQPLWNWLEDTRRLSDP